MHDLVKLAADAKTAREAFEQACQANVISEAEYNLIKDRYEAAMKAHHDALGFGASRKA